MVSYSQLKSNQLPPFIKLKNDDGTETTHYSIFYDGVPEEFEKMPQTELNETEEKKREGLQRLREVLREEGEDRLDDLTLLCMLRKCKYSIHKEEKQIVKLQSFKSAFIEELKVTDMKRLEAVLDHMGVGILPYRDKKGRGILYTNPNVNFERFDLHDGMLCCFSVVFFLLSFPMTSITGLVYIGEGKAPSINVLYQAVKIFRQHIGDALSLPCRIAKAEILNEIFIMRWTAKLIRPILTAKSVGRINFYGSDVRKMRETYHPDLLPDEFGGTMGPLSNTFCKEEILNFIKKLKNE